LIILTEPPSIDSGEITDKGYVNQRATLERRADLVASLFAPNVSPGVISL
jgi:feruloyl-CoA synthase